MVPQSVKEGPPPGYLSYQEEKLEDAVPFLLRLGADAVKHRKTRRQPVCALTQAILDCLPWQNNFNSWK